MSLFRHRIEVAVEEVPDHLVEITNDRPKHPEYVILELAGVKTPVSVVNAKLLTAEYGSSFFSKSDERKPEVQALIDELLKYKS